MISVANFGGNWNNGANSGSRNVNTNTATNSNTNNGSRGVCDDSFTALCTFREVVQADHFRGWSAWLSCFGEYTSGFGRTQSNLERNAEPTLYGAKAQTFIRPHHNQREFSRRLQKDAQGQAQIDELSGIQRVRAAQHRDAETGSGGRWLRSRTIPHFLHSRPQAKTHIWPSVSGSDCAARAQQYPRANIRADIPTVHVCLPPMQRHSCWGKVHSVAPSTRQGYALPQDRLFQVFPVNTLPNAVSNTRPQNLLLSHNGADGDYSATGCYGNSNWQPSKPTERKPVRHVGRQFCALQPKTNGVGALHGRYDFAGQQSCEAA